MGRTKTIKRCDIKQTSLINRDRPIPLRYLVTTRVNHCKLSCSVITEPTAGRMVGTYDNCALAFTAKLIFCEPDQSASLQSHMRLAKPRLFERLNLASVTELLYGIPLRH